MYFILNMGDGQVEADGLEQKNKRNPEALSI